MTQHPLPDIAVGRAPARGAHGHDSPVLVEARTADGTLVGTALARRAPMAIAYFEALEQGMGRVDYEAELDTVRYLDGVTVAAEHRGRGVATALLAEIATVLAADGTRVLFGAIARDENTTARARFFENRGFRLLQSGERLPNFFGRRWTLPHTPDPHTWFYARLPAAAEPA